MPRSSYRFFTAALLAAAFAGGAEASLATLSGLLTADNTFAAYISSSDLVAGDLLCANGTPWAWTSPTSFSHEITEPGTYYLHVMAHDVDGGAAAMLLGQFALDSAAGSFSNGAQALVTDTLHWQLSREGFGISPEQPISFGFNAPSSGWWQISGGGIGSISGQAQYIWASGLSGDVYFSTTITVVPAPAALPLLGILGGMTTRRHRKS